MSSITLQDKHHDTDPNTLSTLPSIPPALTELMLAEFYYAHPQSVAQVCT